MSRVYTASVVLLLCSAGPLSAATITSQVDCSVGLAGGGSLVVTDASNCSLGVLGDIQQAVADASILFSGISFAGGNLTILVNGSAEAGWGNPDEPDFPINPLAGMATFDFVLSLLATTPGPIRPGELSLDLFGEIFTIDGFGIAQVDVAGQSVSHSAAFDVGDLFSGTIPITLGTPFDVSITLQGGVFSGNPSVDSRPARVEGSALVFARASELSGEPVALSEVPEPASALMFFGGLVGIVVFRWRRSSVPEKQV